MPERTERKRNTKNRVPTVIELQRELFKRVTRKPWQGMTFRPIKRSDERPDKERQ